MSRQFEHALQARRPGAYWTRVNDIQETGSRDAFNLARACLASKDRRRRRLGADVLAELGFQQWPRPFGRQSAPLMLAALDREKDPLALAALITAVGRLYIRRAIPKVLKLAGHRSPEVRRALASEMPGCTWDSGEERPDSRVTALLIEMTTDPVAEVRGWACFSLACSVADSPKPSRVVGSSA